MGNATALDYFINEAASISGNPPEALRSTIEAARTYGIRPVRALLNYNMIDHVALKVLYNRHNPTVHITTQKLKIEHARILPIKLVQTHSVVPWGTDLQEDLTIVSGERLYPQAEKEIVRALGAERPPPRFALATNPTMIPLCVGRLLELTRGNAGVNDGQLQHPSIDIPRANFETLVQEETDRDMAAKGLNDLIVTAASNEASDIHIHKTDSLDFVARLRIDGDMCNHATWDETVGRRIIARLSTLCFTELTNEVEAFDGGTTIYIPKIGIYDLRVNLLPLHSGPMMTIRMLPQEQTLDRTIDTIFPATETDIGKHLKLALNSRNGLVLVTGTTGAGKSATLAACCDYVTSDTRKVVTVEDPVELKITGAEQISKTSRLGFADALSAILRADPDYILVGEIRDKATIELAIQATQTGHLLMSSLHARSACSTPERMVGMGVEPRNVSEETLLILNQSLVKKLCQICKGRDVASCQPCGGIGYDGRTVVAECLRFTPEVRQLVAAQAPVSELEQSNGYIGIDTHIRRLIEAQIVAERDVADFLAKSYE